MFDVVEFFWISGWGWNVSWRRQYWNCVLVREADMIEIDDGVAFMELRRKHLNWRC